MGRMRWVICTVMSVMLFVSAGAGASGLSRGITITVRNAGGTEEELQFYAGSYALLIGISNYTAGWPSLESVPAELESVEALLRTRGFTVEKHLDPDSRKLEDVFESFIDRYGYNEQNRLLFYYSGHGHTRKSGRKGYLVPTDAPNPDKDDVGFARKALGMNKLVSWAKDIEAKHAIFLFDSCFSGTIFKHRDLPSPPEHITNLTAEPVRQFITAGKAGETVPANSTFTPVFIDGLRYGLADFNKDGYVTGTELGQFLQEKVPHYSDQHPQFGKIRDYDFDRGDFIFLAGGSPGGTRGQEADVVPPAEYGSLEVVSSPPGAELYIDGETVGHTPFELRGLDPGAVDVQVSMKGYEDGTQQVRITSGQHTLVSLDLERVENTGWLTVETTPEHARVRILNIKPVYQPGIELEAGRYDIEVSAAGYETWRDWLELSAGDDLSVPVRLVEEPRRPPETGSLRVVSRPAGADVIIDGELAGSTPLNLSDMGPGMVMVRISKPGHIDFNQTREILSGRETLVDVELKKELITARLTIVPVPANAKVTILNIQATYFPGIELQAGRYHVEVAAVGHVTRGIFVDLSAGENRQVQVRLQKRPTGRPFRRPFLN